MGYIQPSLTLALCEIASSSLPALRCASIQFHRASGWLSSIELNGIAGMCAQSRKKMLRCRLWLFGIDVHSYEQNAVNFPGWLFCSASWTFSFHTVPATSGVMKALMGGLLVSDSRYRNTLCCCAWSFGSVMIMGCASGSLLTGDPGVLASLVTPTYSEWSVTPMKSIGVRILMS